MTYTGVLSDEDRTSRRAYSGFYGKDHGDPLERRASRASSPASSTWTPGEITGGIYSWYDGDIVEDRRSPARSRTSPTTSWAAATTSSSACSTTAAAATTSPGHNDYIYTYSGVPGLRLHPAPLPPGRADDARWACSSTTRSAYGSRLTFNLGLRYDHSTGQLPLLSGARRARATRPACSHAARRRPVHVEHVSRRASASIWKLTESTARPSLQGALRAGTTAGIVTGEFDDAAPSVTAALPVLGHLRRGREPRAARELCLRQHEPARRLRLQEPVHGPVHRRGRAGAGQEPRALAELRLQARRALRRQPGHRRRSTLPTSTSTAKARAPPGPRSRVRAATWEATGVFAAHQPRRGCSRASTG